MKKMPNVELIKNLKSIEPIVETSTDNEIGSVLMKSHEKYRILFEKLNDAVFLVDVETGLIHDVNKQAEVLLGIPTEEIIGMHYTLVHPVEKLKDVKKLFVKYTETDTSFISEEILVQNRDGRKIPVEISTSIFKSDGRRFILGVLRDITERKWAEEQNKAIIRTAFDGFWMLDIQGRLLEVNEAYCNITGYSNDELLKKSVFDLEALEVYSDTEKHLQRIIETGSDRFESKHRCKDGSVIDIDISVNYIDEKGGRFFAFIRNITKRKETEEGLRKLSRAVTQSPSMIVITDIDGNIEYVNPKFIALTGYTFEEVIGKNPSISKSGKTPPEKYKNLWTTIKSGAEWRGELCNKKKNSELFWESLSISSVKNEKGIITHFIGVKEDITERKKTEEILQQQKTSLEQKNIAISEVLGQIEIEKKQIKDNLISSAELLLLPIIQKLMVKEDSRNYARLLESNLQELASSFGVNLNKKEDKLTAREIEICNMIKHGLTSKEIARISNSSLRTTEKHRSNIRKKLCIVNKKTNLSSYLKTL